MKKMRKYGWGMVMPVVWAACVLGSCKNEVDDVFDQDATSRIEAATICCKARSSVGVSIIRRLTVRW